ncbi:flagellar type III secretion system protein FliR [Eubacteriales bacterium OttesenSCG-928-M02]|nr:flagellar type III secretion system protein FliR [Eubacteriales bacterium OttesenSCG-928-M02]
MLEAVAQVMDNLDIFVLMMIRITALIISSPIFGRRNIPNAPKIGLCLFLTYIVFTVKPIVPIAINGMIDYALLCITELLFGLILGYVTTLFFSVVQTAGYVIDMQMGFGMVNVFDVQNNINVPVTGNFLYILLSITFFVTNGHHMLIQILVNTFDTVPVGHVSLAPELGLAALEIFILAFILAVNISMPILASGLLGELILGFIVRTTPQMNVFVVGIPLKILLGFLVLIMLLPIYVQFTDTIFSEMFRAVDYMIQGLIPG